jgi:CDP-diacylglycerol--inositol 3-phosphatidyltransferase
MPSRWQVLFYVPNLIGYARLVLILLAFHVFRSDPLVFLGLYALQAILDGAWHGALYMLVDNRCTA